MKVLAVFIVFVGLPPSVSTGSSVSDRSSILSAGEKFFISLRDRDSRSSWRLLTRDSRERIVASVQREMLARGRKIDLQAIHDDFAINGKISKEYWSAFLSHFNPDAALNESVWELQEFNDREAILRITHRASRRPALLRLFREDGMWKVGFVETFVRPGGP